MREVEIRLHFLEPCLSGIKAGNQKGPRYIFNRDASGRHALIMQERWTRLLSFGCKASSLSTRLSTSVWFDPVVRAEINRYRRYFDPKQPTQFKVHEAFLSGQEAAFRAVLHDPLSLKEFTTILSAGGRFAGLTSFGWGKYGRFEVISVK